MKKIVVTLLVLAVAIILTVSPLTALAANTFSANMEVGVEVTREDEKAILEKAKNDNAASFTIGLNSGKVSWKSPDGKDKDFKVLSPDEVPSMDGIFCEKYIAVEDKSTNKAEYHLVAYGTPVRAGTYTFELVYNNYMNTEETGIEMGTTTSSYTVTVNVTGEDAAAAETPTGDASAPAATASDATPIAPPAENDGLPTGLLIGIIAGVVVIAAVVVIVIVAKKKKK